MRGSTVKRGKTWSFIVDAPAQPGQKRKREWHGGYPTKAEAESALADHLHSLSSGGYVGPHRETVATFGERWLRDYAASNVAPRTLIRYEQIVRGHVVPALGSLKLAALRPTHILAAEREWLEKGRADGTGLSKRTVLHHHRLLREMLQSAVRWQLIPRNPADAVEPPRPERTDMRVLNRDQAATLLQATEGTDLGDVVLMAVNGGMRLGELLGIRWSDLDLGTGELRIQQTAIRLGGGVVTFGQPKTHRSRRAVTVSTSVLEMLRRRRGQQVDAARLAGPAYVNQGLVFADALGGVLDQDRLRRQFYAALAEHHLPRIRLHDLRHTAATLLLGLGVHPKIVSERLGHSTVTITLDTYSHVLPGLQAEAAKRLDDWLRGGSADGSGGQVTSIEDGRAAAADAGS